MLGGVVEDRHLRLVFVARGEPDDLLERLGGHRRVFHEIVERGDIGLMVLAVVEAHGVRREKRLQGGLGIGQRGKLEDHGVLLKHG
jgi:hypothetical protein